MKDKLALIAAAALAGALAGFTVGGILSIYAVLGVVVWPGL